MTEKIVIHVEVDGVELAPIELGEGVQDGVYIEDIVFFRMGDLFNKEHTVAPYSYMFRLNRHKTEGEKHRERGAEK